MFELDNFSKLPALSTKKFLQKIEENLESVVKLSLMEEFFL